jgi:Zn-dependent metalloprotease
MNTRNVFLFIITFIILSVSAQQSDIDIINNYLDDNIEKFSYQTKDINEIFIKDKIDSNNSFISLYVQQRFNGIDIFNAISTVAINNNKVVSFANRFQPLIDNKINVKEPSITAREAIISAVNNLDLGPIKDITLIEEAENYFTYSAPEISKENINAKLTYFPMPDSTLRLAWDFSILTLNKKNWYSIRIDAINGLLINVNDWIINCEFDSKEELNYQSNINVSRSVSSVDDESSYRVFALPTESPNHGSYELVNEPANEIASPFGWHDINGVTGPEYTITRGNNVWAREDIEVMEACLEQIILLMAERA